MPATLPPSIFNDVVGPIMRGPSSSHSAASVRIGRLARDLCGGDPEHVLVEFDTEGSLATTHESQGSDMGLGRLTHQWNQVAGPGPSARFGAAMTYDGTLGRVVLQGGDDGTNELGDLAAS